MLYYDSIATQEIGRLGVSPSPIPTINSPVHAYVSPTALHTSPNPLTLSLKTTYAVPFLFLHSLNSPYEVGYEFSSKTIVKGAANNYED